MLPREVRIGHVFRYSYLWHRDHVRGKEEGDKDRPCLVLALVMMLDDGTPVVRVLPITHSPPADPRHTIEIPAVTKQRLGLDSERSWIVLTESNRFAWPGPDVRPVDNDNGYYGPLPPGLFSEIKRRFVELARAGLHEASIRTD